MTTHHDEVPLALARMFPHGRAAIAAARLLAHHDIIEDALDTAVHLEGHGGLDHSGLAQAQAAVEEFRAALAEESAAAETHAGCAPLTGTPGHNIVHALAETVLTMPEPKPGDGGWRQAAYKQIEKTGSNYVQVWKDSATYYAYTRQGETGGN